MAARAHRDEPVRGLRPGAPADAAAWPAVASGCASGLAIATALTLVAGTAFGGAAIANELSLRDTDRPSIGSRFGPTDLGPDVEPPSCDGACRGGLDRAPCGAVRAARSTDGRAGPSTLSVTGRARTSAGSRTSPPTVSWASTARPGAAMPGGYARPAAGWVPTVADGRPGLDARPADGRRGAHRRRPSRPPRTTASRSSKRAPARRCRVDRRRVDLPGDFPPGRVARRRRTISSAGAASSTTGSSSTVRSARSRARSTARPAGSRTRPSRARSRCC